MKTKIKHGFNLIEITLAIAIIAFGMSSILVLFPTGLQTTTDAVANSVVPDTADYVLSYLQALVDVGWRDENGVLRTNNTILDALDDKKPDTAAAEPGGGLKYDQLDNISADNEKTVNLFKAKGKKGIYLYEQSYYPTATEDFKEQEKMVDFSAIVLVWKEKAYLYHEGDTPKEVNDDNAVTLCVEISYPAAKPYAAREKQFYRLELYNQAWKTEGI